jgi:hypothetical protein
LSVGVVGIYAGLLAFDLWLLLLHREGSWPEKLGFLFALLGLYTFAFGLVVGTELGARLRTLPDDLTSPDLFRFAAGNMLLFAVVTAAFSVALNPRKRAEGLPSGAGGVGAYLVASLALTTLGLMVFIVWLVVYLVLIAPLAYAAYVVVSFPLREIEMAAVDQEIAVTHGDTGTTERITVRELVQANPIQLRNLLVGIPSLALALALQAPSFV